AAAPLRTAPAPGQAPGPPLGAPPLGRMGTGLAGLLLDAPGTLQDKQDARQLDWEERLEVILNSFYAELRQRHAKERQAFDDRPCVDKITRSTMDISKWNQQEVYLDPSRCLQARASSKRHLERHRAWLAGPRRCGDVALHDLVAVQHYLDMDLEDLQLPEAERRNRDSFAKGGLVSEQMLLDAPRATLVVDGEQYNFAEYCERAWYEGATSSSSRPLAADRAAGPPEGAAAAAEAADALHAAASAADQAASAPRAAAASAPQAPFEERAPRLAEHDEGIRGAFLEEVTAAVMRSLARHGEPPPLLVRAVTSAMSQSGLASVERACFSSQVVVSGGAQRVTYALQAREDGAWDVTLSVRKHGFDQCIIWSEMSDLGLDDASQGSPLIVPCTESSFVEKECGVRYHCEGEHVQVDVYKLQKEMSLADPSGSLMTGLKVTEDESYSTGLMISRGTDPVFHPVKTGEQAAWSEIGAGTYRMQKTAKKPGGRKFLYSAPFKGTFEDAQNIAEQVGGAFIVKFSRWLQVVGDDSYDAGDSRDSSSVIYQRSPPPPPRVSPLDLDDSSRHEAHVAAMEAAESVAFAAAVADWRRQRAAQSRPEDASAAAQLPARALASLRSLAGAAAG
ncbi:unnamed protein product, partial [Prorocentrum cordatum]